MLPSSRFSWTFTTAWLVCLTRLLLFQATAGESGSLGYLAPVRTVAWGEQGRIAVLGSHGRRLLVVDPDQGDIVGSWALPGPGSDLTVRNGIAMVAICQPAGHVMQFDLRTGVQRGNLSAGHSPSALALTGDGRLLGVANRFDNSIDLITVATGKRKSIPVIREPIDLVLSRDGKRLFVANHLPCVRPFLDDENPFIACEVSVIDLQAGEVIRHIELPNGSQGLRRMALSPDGRIAVVTHILSNYTVPTMRLAGGRMNRNAISLISTDRLQLLGTVALDDPELGAANPWDVAFTENGEQLLVTHAGTHELSIIDFDELCQRMEARPLQSGLFDPEQLELMAGIRQRLKLPVVGPRSLAVDGDRVFVAGYFSDDFACIQLNTLSSVSQVIALDRRRGVTADRLGEQYFHDASLCHQRWQSCATCHPDGRSDVMYWDLLNDGVGNTKNTKSLLMSALTPPVMWRGVRRDANAAIRSGVHHIQFATPAPGQAEAIEAYLLNMKAVPSPFLNASTLEPPKTEDASCAKCHVPGVPRGTLSGAARRGKAIFEGKAGCVQCHPHPTFTSQQQVDPGLGSGVSYDVPSLVELWRTAPYLHGGDALDLRETITDFNFLHRRGATHELTDQELNDLIAYLRSL